MKYILISLFSVLFLVLLIIVFNYFKGNETPVPVMHIKQTAEEKPVPTYCTFLPYWDFDNALSEVKDEHAINTISPFVYTLQDDLTIKRHLDYKDKIIELDSDLLVLPTINNDFDPERVSEVINSVTKRAKHIDEITLLVIDDNTDGIIIDYELVIAEDKDAFSTFIEELGSNLHAQDKLLYVAVHPKRNDSDSWSGAASQDWRRLAISADKVIVMAYDYSWSGSDKPGPIAPYYWVRDITNYAKNTLGNKGILGFGIYGYDWVKGKQEAETRTIKELTMIANQTESESYFNNNFISPYMTYELGGIQHTVWYEDTKSIEAKLKLLTNYSGYCIWRSGGIPRSYYEIFSKYH